MELHIHIFLPSPAQNKKPSSEAPSKKNKQTNTKNNKKIKKMLHECRFSYYKYIYEKKINNSEISFESDFWGKMICYIHDRI